MQAARCRSRCCPRMPCLAGARRLRLWCRAGLICCCTCHQP